MEIQNWPINWFLYKCIARKLIFGKQSAQNGIQNSDGIVQHRNEFIIGTHRVDKMSQNWVDYR